MEVLRYDLEQGKSEAAILDQAYKGNEEVPDAIKNAPELYEGLAFYYRAFLDLSTCREIGMAEGPIPWNALDTYASRYGLIGEERERFFTLMRALDGEYLRYREKTRPKGK